MLNLVGGMTSDSYSNHNKVCSIAVTEISTVDCKLNVQVIEEAATAVAKETMAEAARDVRVLAIPLAARGNLKRIPEVWKSFTHLLSNHRSDT